MALVANVPVAAPSPGNIYFDRLKNVTERINGLGSLLISGIERDEDDEEEDGDEEKDIDLNKYTEDQISTLRHVLITKRRDKAMKNGQKVSDPEDGWFNTNTGNIVIQSIPGEIKKILKKSTIPEKFDYLFGLTYALYIDDSWMYDNEEWGEGGELDNSIRLIAKVFYLMLLLFYK